MLEPVTDDRLARLEEALLVAFETQQWSVIADLVPWIVEISEETERRELALRAQELISWVAHHEQLSGNKATGGTWATHIDQVGQILQDIVRTLRHLQWRGARL